MKDKNKWQLLKACEEPGDWYSLASELGQEKYPGQNVAKDNALTLSKLKFVLLSLRILSCNIIVCNICIYGCFLRKIEPIC